MVEGDAKYHAEQLALTTRRIRFKQNRQLQEESHARYIKELVEVFDRLVSELNDSLAGLYRIKVEQNSVEIFQDEGEGNTPIGSVSINYQTPRHFTFQYNDKDGYKEEEAFLLDAAGPDIYLCFKAAGHQSLRADALADHVLAKELQIVERSIQYQLRLHPGMGGDR